jgi:hypothetical protein
MDKWVGSYHKKYDREYKTKASVGRSFNVLFASQVFMCHTYVLWVPRTLDTPPPKKTNALGVAFVPGVALPQVIRQEITPDVARCINSSGNSLHFLIRLCELLSRMGGADVPRPMRRKRERVENFCQNAAGEKKVADSSS